MNKRRSKGEGVGAYQTSDGRWRAEINLGITGDGKRKRKVIYGDTRAEVDIALRSQVMRRDDGTLLEGKSLTLQAWLDYWLDNVASVKLRPRTELSYRSIIKNWVTPHRVGGVALNKLTAEHLEQVYGSMRSAGRSETYIAQLHRVLSRALTIAERRGKIVSNPAKRLDAPQPAKYEPRLISLADAQKLIRAAASWPNGARWMVALALGLRQGEALALGWDAVDLESRVLRVDKELYRMPWKHGCTTTDGQPTCGRAQFYCPRKHSGGVHVGPPKSEAGNRVVPLPQELVDCLVDLKRENALKRLQAGQRWVGFTSQNGVEIDLVFCSEVGNSMNSQDDWSDWKQFLRASGVPAARVHDARHTSATLLLQMKVPERIVMEVMGWSSSAMTKRYQHVLDDMKHSTAAQVGSFLWSGADKPVPPQDDVIIDLAARRARRSGS